MQNFSILNKVQEIYRNNGNIIDYLKTIENREKNTVEDVLISYDFQAGSYTNSYKHDPASRDRFSSHLAEIFNQLDQVDSMLEAGVGEATIMGLTLPLLNKRPQNIYGFDLSWSRIKYANAFLKERQQKAQLFVGDLFNMPLKSNSIDMVYTVHAVEPNGGREKEALEELYRISRKYIVLVEPSFELASDEARARMDRLGYVKGLYSKAIELGYQVIEHKLFEANYHNLNPASVIIIQKETTDTAEVSPICCPITKASLSEQKSCFFSEESLLAYPVIDGVPCLLAQNAIVATKLMSDL